LNNKLLAYLLQQCERSPNAKFYESDLRRISSSDFLSLKKLKCLSFDQYDFEDENYVDKQGGERFVRKVNGRWLATSTEDSGISPIYLNEADLNRYIFNIMPLLAGIKTENSLARSIDAVTPRVWFVGVAQVLQNTVGVFLAFISDDEQGEAELLGLRAKIGKVDDILVLCPTYAPKAQELLNKFAGIRLTCLTFKEAFSKNNYGINFSKVRLVQASEQQVQRLTPQQTEDYTKYAYLCQDRVHIPGTASLKRSNDIDINGQKIKMPDGAFRVFIELLVQLKKGKGGWLTMARNEGEYQIFGRVREPLTGSLLGKKDGKTIIESNGSKGYRISTHPDFVTYNLTNLKKHADPLVQGFAKKLPKA